jgi:spermidine synthase
VPGVARPSKVATVRRAAPLLVASFSSGYAALAYEMLWTRITAYFIGSDANALGAILGVFSVSLCIGAVASRRWLGGARALRAYTVVEACTAAFGALEGAAWLFFRHETAGVLSSVGAQSPVAAAGVCGLFLVAVPGLLMGATLPLLTSALPRGALRDVYAANVFGAFAGALSVGGFVLPWSSVSMGFLVAITFNLLAAAAVAPLARDEPRASGAAPVGADRPHARLRPSRAGASAFFAGVASFSLEVLLFRVVRIRLGCGSTDWTVALLVGSFLLGLSLGGFLFERGLRISVWVIAGAPAIAVAAAVAFFETSGPEALSVVRSGVGLAQSVFVALLTASIAAPFGYLFPYLVGREEERAEDHASATSTILAQNSLGNFCGSAAAGFFVAPHWGALHGLAVPIAMLGVAVLLIPVERDRARRGGAVAACLLGAAAVLAAPPSVLQPEARRASIVATSEDAFGAYALSRSGDSGLVLLRYGQPVSATFGDQRDNTHLAFDLIEDVGLARSRIVAGGLGGACHLREAIERGARDPSLFRNLKVVELSPAVFGLARSRYGLPESALRLVELGDFRSSIREETADVYYVDLLSPVNEGSGYAYTREFHEEVRRSLSRNGMLIEWLGRKLGVVGFLAEITRTADSVWGGGYVLHTRRGHYLFVATKAPGDEALVERALERLEARTDRDGNPPFEFWSTRTALARLGAASAAIVTEDAIPFGRVVLGFDSRPALAREARLLRP